MAFLNMESMEVMYRHQWVNNFYENFGKKCWIYNVKHLDSWSHVYKVGFQVYKYAIKDNTER